MFKHALLSCVSFLLLLASAWAGATIEVRNLPIDGPVPTSTDEIVTYPFLRHRVLEGQPLEDFGVRAAFLPKTQESPYNALIFGIEDLDQFRSLSGGQPFEARVKISDTSPVITIRSDLQDGDQIVVVYPWAEEEFLPMRIQVNSGVSPTVRVHPEVPEEGVLKWEQLRQNDPNEEPLIEIVLNLPITPRIDQSGSFLADYARAGLRYQVTVSSQNGPLQLSQSEILENTGATHVINLGSSTIVTATITDLDYTGKAQLSYWDDSGWIFCKEVEVDDEGCFAVELLRRHGYIEEEIDKYRLSLQVPTYEAITWPPFAGFPAVELEPVKATWRESDIDVFEPADGDPIPFSEMWNIFTLDSEDNLLLYMTAEMEVVSEDEFGRELAFRLEMRNLPGEIELKHSVAVRLSDGLTSVVPWSGAERAILSNVTTDFAVLVELDQGKLYEVVRQLEFDEWEKDFPQILADG